MVPQEALLASLGRACRGADLAVIEGVMGLFDGFGYQDEAGSTAYLAKLVAAPVVIVLNAASLGRSAGAMALGYATYDPDLRILGSWPTTWAARATAGAWRRPSRPPRAGPVSAGCRAPRDW